MAEDPDPTGTPDSPDVETDLPAADLPEAFDQERAMATIRKQREEVKTYKAQAKEAEALRNRLQQIEDADKTESQRLTDQVADYQQREQTWAAEKKDTSLRLAVSERAQELGITSPRLAVAALKMDGTTIEWDNEDNPTNLDDVLAELIEREPGLKGTPAPPRKPATNAGDGGKEGPPPALTAEELEAAVRFGKTPEQYAALKDVKSFDDWTSLQTKQ